MGALQKHSNISGRTLKEAFSQLQREDEREYGDDHYSGGWNNSQGVREVTAKEFDKIYSEGDISKFESAIAKCVRKPVLNSNSIKTQVTSFPNKGARKWLTMYVAVVTNRHHYVNIKDKSQAEAIKKARKYIDVNPGVEIRIDIEKHLIDQNPKVAEISYKPAKNET
jgi:hypothetical protein